MSQPPRWKGGYDYCVPILSILHKHFLPILLLLFNIMFYDAYPIKLAYSLLITITKCIRKEVNKSCR